MTTVLNGKPTFGAGRAFAKANVTNPTPARALVPQSQSIDLKRKVESLYGEKQLPVAVGAGQMDITGKVEYGKSQARLLADIMLGDTGTAGSYLEADGEAGMVPGSTTFTIQVTNHANYLFDLGVVNADTGVIYTRVANGSEVAATSYSVAESGGSKGTYTFAAGDANAHMQISYVYTNTAGETVVMTNQLQGLTGNFTGVHVFPWGAEQDMIVFNQCIASQQSLASTKNGGFSHQTLEYSAFTDGNDNLGTATFAEVA